MLVDVPFGEETGLSVDFDHALHSMKEVQPLLEGFPLPFEADDVSGTQRYLSLDVGVRLGMLFIDETRIKPNQVTALPWFRMGLGLCFTDTILDFPSLEGVRTLRSRVPMVTFNPGFGVSIHVLRQLTIQPVIKSALLVGLDHNEPKNNDVLRLEWQLKPTLDLLYNF
jgi:hypothetical protein